MRVSELNSLGCQAVHVRRWDLGFRVVRSHIAIAHVVCQNDHDVRVGSGGLLQGARREPESEQARCLNEAGGSNCH